jgi:excisionase family DNA binding protein
VPLAMVLILLTYTPVPAVHDASSSILACPREPFAQFRMSLEMASASMIFPAAAALRRLWQNGQNGDCGSPTIGLSSLRRFPLLPQFPLSVSFKEAAEMTSVSRSTLRRYAKDGRLRTVQLGRRRVIPFEALQELVRERREGTE